MGINPFLANVPILYPLKTPENQRFSGVFRAYKMGTLALSLVWSVEEDMKLSLQVMWLLRDSWNYIPHILVPFSVKRVATQN